MDRDLRQCTIIRLTAALLLAMVFATAAGAAYRNEDCKCSAITPEQMWRADAWLWLSPRDKRLSVAEHLPWGAPIEASGARHERLLIQRDYVTDYDGDLRDPLWVAYKLTRSDISTSRPRTECFRQDVRLSYTSASTCADYSEPIYDQGHLAPNADFTRSLRAMLNTYVMSNMTPQHCAFNRGTWLILEQLTRDWVQTEGTLYVISGSVFDRDGTPGRDPDSAALRMASNDGEARVAVPSAFYKILVHRGPGGVLKSLSVLVPNTEVKIGNGESAQRQYLVDHLVSIADIEQETGLTFFPALVTSDPSAADALKHSKATTLWPTTTWPSRLDQLCH